LTSCHAGAGRQFVCYGRYVIASNPYTRTCTLTNYRQDAGIAYTDTRYSFDEYPQYKSSTIAELNPTATIPVIELNGRILTQSYAILRHMSRLLGGTYDGTTEEEKYFTDLICDIVVDCTFLSFDCLTIPLPLHRHA
jgi:glutathione S-transferase